MSTVRVILKRKGERIVSIGKDETVYAAIERMTQNNIGALIVKDGEKVAGILTERDYLRDVALKGRSSQSTKVEEIMSSPVILASPEDTIQECMKVMTEKGFRHLPVDGGEGLVGVISIGDLVSQLIRDQGVEIQELQDYIQGKRHN